MLRLAEIEVIAARADSLSRAACGQNRLAGDRLAEHSEGAQWVVRPAVLVDRPPFSEPLPIDLSAITMEELGKVVRALADSNASGPDGYPIEYCQALLEGGAAAAYLLQLSISCWETRSGSDSWHISRVSLLFQEGRPELMRQSRPSAR